VIEADRRFPKVEEGFLLPQVWDRRVKVEIRRLDVPSMHELFQ
jgi:hypothetical protein